MRLLSSFLSRCDQAPASSYALPRVSPSQPCRHLPRRTGPAPVVRPWGGSGPCSSSRTAVQPSKTVKVKAAQLHMCTAGMQWRVLARQPPVPSPTHSSCFPTTSPGQCSKQNKVYHEAVCCKPMSRVCLEVGLHALWLVPATAETSTRQTVY